MLLPIDHPDNPSELALLDAFINQSEAFAIQLCPTLAALPPDFQSIALYSHFCFRIVVWDIRILTPRPLRTALSAIISRENLAKRLCVQIRDLKDRAESYEDCARAAMGYVEYPIPISVGCVHASNEEILGRAWAQGSEVEKFVVREIVERGADLGAFAKEGKYQGMESFEGMNAWQWRCLKSGLKKTRKQVLQHLKCMVHEYYLKPQDSGVRKEEVELLEQAVYRAYVT